MFNSLKRFAYGVKVGFAVAKAKTDTTLVAPVVMTTPAGKTVRVYYSDSIFLSASNGMSGLEGGVSLKLATGEYIVAISEKYKDNSFLLYHEFAHIDLGHLDGNFSNKLVDKVKYISDKFAELECDEYAYRFVGDNLDDLDMFLEYLQDVFNKTFFVDLLDRKDNIISMMRNRILMAA